MPLGGLCYFGGNVGGGRNAIAIAIAAAVAVAANNPFRGQFVVAL